jgi:hypothetical protein
MMTFTGSKTDVVQFVNVLLYHFALALQSITITTPEKLEVYSVTIVTDVLSGDTVREMGIAYSLLPTTT